MQNVDKWRHVPLARDDLVFEVLAEAMSENGKDVKLKKELGK